ncbi:MAG: amino acid adenylation domain-containing protein [Clostridia bacterium]
MAVRTELFPLSHPQKGIWYLEKMYPNTCIGNISATLKFEARLDYEIANEAFNHVLRLNDALRIQISETGEDAQQYITEYTPWKFDYLDFSKNEIKELYEWDSNMNKIPIYKTDSPLFYIAIIKINENMAGFYVKLHHMIADAWTLVTFGNEVLDYYNRIAKGLGMEELSKPSYTEYIANEQKYYQSERFAKDEAFWLETFQSIPDLTTLKEKKSGEASIRASRKTFMLPEKLCRKIREHCRENRTSIFSLFLGAVAIYINRTRGENEIVFGTPVLNRSNYREKETMGMFISTVPIRVRIDESQDYNTFAEAINKEWMSILRHQKYPYTLLLKKLREKNPGLEKLYDIIISYQNAKFIKNESSHHQEGRWHQNGYQTDALNIHINDREDDGDIIIDYDYLTTLFYAKEIEFLHDHVVRLLWHSIDNPGQRLTSIEMISENEKQRILNDFNCTGTAFQKDKTIHQLLKDQVRKTPDQVAIVFEDKEMTYAELNKKANNLAGVLIEKGVRPNQIVGLMLHRSFDMMVGLFGILMAGAAYLPIDPDFPKERIEYMLENSETQVLVSESRLKDTVQFAGEILLMDDDRMHWNEEKVRVQNFSKGTDLAYVIYTSGSTGRPKGVMIEHRPVVNFMKGITGVIDFTGKTIISVTTISFDIFVLETILPLLHGVKVVLANESEQKIPHLLHELIRKQNVNMLQTTPSRIQMLLNDEANSKCLSYLSDLMVGGEAFPHSMLMKLKGITKARIFNMYGPTETTVWSAIKELTGENAINIGKPIANTRMYILDKYLNLLPIGVPGELCIGGEGLSRGYLKSEELTREKFVENPYEKGTNIYRTGDIARWYPQGELEYIRREDTQVKIRGFRIEMGEIEKEILSFAGIRETVVLDGEDEAGNKYLCAYIVYEQELSVVDLKNHLLKRLPGYMVPTFFKRIDHIPLTPNGKLDKKKLLEQEAMLLLFAEYIKPANPVEKKVAEICGDMLGIKKVGMGDNYFDIGGDSLSLINFFIRLGKEFKKDIALTEIHKSLTLRDIADYVVNGKDIGETEDENLVLLKKGGQGHLFFIHAGNGEPGAYLPLCNLLPGDLNHWAFRFDRLQDYAPLNTSIEEIAGKYLAAIRKKQAKGPYMIAGWCIGGTIAFEIARQMEAMGEQVGFLGLINTIAPKKWEGVESFNIGTESAFIHKNLQVQIQPEKDATMGSLWKKVLSLFPESGYPALRKAIPPDISIIIPNYEKDDIRNIMYYINVIRTLHTARALYFPPERLMTNTVFFNAVLDQEIIPDKKENIQAWNSYLKVPMKIFRADGDHFSILKAGVQDFAETFSKALSSGAMPNLFKKEG